MGWPKHKKRKLKSKIGLTTGYAKSPNGVYHVHQGHVGCTSIEELESAFTTGMSVFKNVTRY